MNKKIVRYFNIAKAISYTSDFPRVHIGAILVIGKEIIAASANMRKSNPLQKTLNRYRFEEDDHCHNAIHAEMNCILKARGKDLSRAKLFVYRENKMGQTAMCRPCIACMHEIINAGIEDIYYTTQDGFCHEEVKDV